MRKKFGSLLRQVIPTFVIGMLSVAPVYSAEEAAKKIEKTADMPPPPPGPYRSMHGADRSAGMPMQHEPPKWVQQQREWMQKQRAAQRPDARQWTAPTPPQWAQQRPQLPQRPDWVNRQPPPKWVQEQRQQMAKSYEPPKWVQEQRKQAAKKQEDVKQDSSTRQPPKWVQEQRQQMAKPYDPPKWVQEQRAQAAKRQQRMQECVQPAPRQQQAGVQGRQWTPPAPPQWTQRRTMPPQYSAYRGYQRAPMPYWGPAPYPQYRR